MFDGTQKLHWKILQLGNKYRASTGRTQFLTEIIIVNMIRADGKKLKFASIKILKIDTRFEQMMVRLGIYRQSCWYFGKPIFVRIGRKAKEKFIGDSDLDNCYGKKSSYSACRVVSNGFFNGGFPSKRCAIYLSKHYPLIWSFCGCQVEYNSISQLFLSFQPLFLRFILEKSMMLCIVRTI